METILYILFVMFAICFILLVVSILFLLEKLAKRSIIGLYVTGILIIVVATISHFLLDSKQTNVEDNMVNAVQSETLNEYREITIVEITYRNDVPVDTVVIKKLK